MSESKAPPLGVMPENIWKEKRVHELDRAIREYLKADGLTPKPEWYAEYYQHMSWLVVYANEERDRE